MTREEELQELEFRKPKKPAYTSGAYPDFWEMFACPSCLSYLGKKGEYAFCPCCGQKLDWSVLDDQYYR